MYHNLANQRSAQIKNQANLIVRHSSKQINNLIYYSIKPALKDKFSIYWLNRSGIKNVKYYYSSYDI